MKADRDRLLENALPHALRAGDLTPASALCLDAETLAAWLDGGLDAPAIAMAQAHASNCTRCQALLGTAIRIAPPVPAAEAHGARLWRWWLAPVAATAAAATLWMVVPRQPTLVPASAPAKEEAVATAPEATVQTEPARGRANAAPSQRAETGANKRDAQTFEERERKAETPKLADRALEERVAAAAPASPAPPAVAQLSKQVDPLADAQVTARSSPTPDVIWLVGRAGLVQLATDGRTFLRVPFPETVDLTAVTATDERSAMVTAADGRRFETADAGKTWRLRP